MQQIENIVIPGRHHVLTNFQHDYLEKMLTEKIVTSLDGTQFELIETPNLI
jgi:hypothetical protein